MNQTNLLAKLLWVFFEFCLLASSVYIINDMRDTEADRKHPKKHTRPLASGLITVAQALGLLFLLIVCLFILVFLSSPPAVVVELFITYFLINLAYSFYLKTIPLLDIGIIAIGFLIRIFVGSLAVDVPNSKWIVLMTFMLALFLAMGKRRDDLISNIDKAEEHRPALSGYNLRFTDIATICISTISIVCYIMYTMSDEVIKRLNSEYIYTTSGPVIFGFLRYLQVIYIMNDSGSPTKVLLGDRVLQSIILIWVIMFLVFIYLRG